MNHLLHDRLSDQTRQPPFPTKSDDAEQPVALHSNFAVTQLTAIALESQPAQFTLAMAPIFGYDLPPDAYNALRDALIAGALPNPTIELVTEGTYAAEYDNKDRVIRIHADTLRQAIQAPESSWELLAILLHEFGHHIDNVLRNDLAPRFPHGIIGIASDSPAEEGSRYANAMAALRAPRINNVVIASYSLADGQTFFIETSYGAAMEHIVHTQIDSEGLTTDSGRFEKFEAGVGSNGHFTHNRIRASLVLLGFSEEELQKIEFGSWLRDHSQLIDPKLVRREGEPGNFPAVLGRDALTRMVDILAAREFSGLRAGSPNEYTVTQENLGVYRASQHIDNPRVENPLPDDPTAVDPDFEPWLRPGDRRLQIDPERSMKIYLRDSIAQMYWDLEAAVAGGLPHALTDIDAKCTNEGLRRFGAGLHILEDFFAHSNFVELSLIKAGYKVLPWTAPADCKWGLPVVTGMFGSTDVIASLATPIAKLLMPDGLFDFTPSEPGHRSDTEKMMLILLKEQGKFTELAALTGWLNLRDRWAALPGSTVFEFGVWLASTPRRGLGNLVKTAFAGSIILIGNSIDDLQTAQGDPNEDNSIDPTHSQLSKDHAEHPLHALAAGLALSAIRQVAAAMLQSWEREPDAADPAEIAASFFSHPQDSTWQDELVEEWALENPDKIRKAASKSDLEELNYQLETAKRKAFQEFAKNGLASHEYVEKHFEDLFGKE